MQVLRYAQHAMYACAAALWMLTLVQADDKPCKVSDIHVEEDFDVQAFAGTWYVAMDTGLFRFQRTFDSIFFLMQDLKYYFEPQQDGNFRVITSKYRTVYRIPCERPPKIQRKMSQEWYINCL